MADRRSSANSSMFWSQLTHTSSDAWSERRSDESDGGSGTGRKTLMLGGCDLDSSGMSASDLDANGAAASGHGEISLEVAERISNQLKDIILFKDYDEDQLTTVVSNMVARSVQAGEIVFKQGDPSDTMFVIDDGEFTTTAELSDGTTVQVAKHYGAGVLGEVSLLHNKPAAATVKATTSGKIFALNAGRYYRLRRQQAEANAKLLVEFFASVPLFGGNLSLKCINRLLDAVQFIIMQPGEVICRQGDPADAMYFLLDGAVAVSIDGECVKTLGSHDFFGERALITDEGRAATCTVSAKARLAKLDRDHFSALVPECVVDKLRQHMQQHYPN